MGSDELFDRTVSTTDVLARLDGKLRRKAGRLSSRFYKVLLILSILVYLFWNTLSIWKRDSLYILRPLWDDPDPPWKSIVPRYSPTGDLSIPGVTEQWCELHGWSARERNTSTGEITSPVIIDAFLFSSELDMLEIRMREMEPFGTIHVIVEANMTFAGTPKRAYFAENRDRFNFIPRDRIVHVLVTDLEPNTPKGSFANEATMAEYVTEAIQGLVSDGRAPPGSLIIHADVDEVISRETVQLLASCQGYPSPLHLNVDNYRYSYEFPLQDQGYSRPQVTTYNATDPESTIYAHRRMSDDVLMGAGWHCSFCFETIGEMRDKMTGYSHNDRVKSKSLLKMENLRKRVCSGQDPFDMYPVSLPLKVTVDLFVSFLADLALSARLQEAYSFKDLIAQSGRPRRSRDFTNVPVAVKRDPKRFRYLLDGGCDRPL